MISLGLDVDEDSIIPDAPAPSCNAPPAQWKRCECIICLTLESPTDILIQVTKPRFLPPPYPPRLFAYDLYFTPGHARRRYLRSLVCMSQRASPQPFQPVQLSIASLKCAEEAIPILDGPLKGVTELAYKDS